MNKAKMQIKTGDRVFYFSSGSDYGKVVGLLADGRIKVKFESGAVGFCPPHSLQVIRKTTSELCLKFNNCAMNDLCALCDTRMDPVAGIELFLEGTWKPVCNACGCRLAPKLVEARNLLSILPLGPERDRKLKVQAFLEEVVAEAFQGPPYSSGSSDPLDDLPF